jgi:hypothetical protein
MSTINEMIEQLQDCIKQKVINGEYRILGLLNLTVGMAEILIDEQHKLTLWVRDDKKELTIFESDIFQEHLVLTFGNFNDEVESSENEGKIAYNNFQKLINQYNKDHTVKVIEANIKRLERELQLLKTNRNEIR